MRLFKLTMLLFVGLLLSAQQVWATQITVSKNGDITSVQAGIDQAQPGDTVFVKAGRYVEYNIQIDKRITLLGEDNAIIDGDEQGFVVVVKADSTVIKDIEVHNSKAGFMDDYAGIVVEEANNVHIENVKMVNNFFGIYLAKSEGTIVKGNHIIASRQRETNSGNGIHLWYTKDVEITNNYVSGHRDGLYFEFVEGAFIAGNESENNIRYGIHFMYSDNCRYERNTFRDNGGGVAVMYTSNVEIVNNHFADNWGSSAYGMLLKEINRSIVTGNTFTNNSVGLYMEASSRNKVKDNAFEQNGWAVKLMANSTNNTFTENNFIANSFEVSTNSRMNYSNNFDHNYWSQYEGYDLDRDGVGDVPHRPVRLFSILVEKQPQSLLLLRSLLIDLLDAAEKFMPVLTPETLIDSKPQMEPVL
ncbi:nitrous oxidase accessory protein [Fodinibius salinus]|uniref:Nitrous oxidase accessory protein n=1 Tax=Fodinibius salinus TaxID=860790 RepID=A0A5D3YLZ6_9BACT|nr:nitrous oxide reductase family maturation protein NosD [Fodinibius salinus]TYP94792.1 nitrous oxidase accessory protein [Fodinibius salinus]